MTTRSSYSWTTRPLTSLHNTVSYWPVDDDEPVAAVPTPDLIAYAAELTDGDQRDLEHAVEWPTLRPVTLQGGMLSHWELDRRAVRRASRPLVEVEPGTLFLCPWAASMSRRISPRPPFRRATAVAPIGTTGRRDHAASYLPAQPQHGARAGRHRRAVRPATPRRARQCQEGQGCSRQVTLSGSCVRRVPW
jgi:hypothetical protein